MVKWEKARDHDYHHTAVTKYLTDGYVIWKGKYHIFSCFYSANEWHLERVSDHHVMWSARTAKACMENFEFALKAEINR